MSNVVRFPDDQRAFTKAEIDELHSAAFRDLEGRISDCALMASISLQLVEHAIEGNQDKHEKAMFAVFEVARMLKRLKVEYHAAWHAEPAPPEGD